jgi:molybdopterin synthase sulfur carrier subunit
LINILYFASLREQVGISAEEMELPSGGTVESVQNILGARNGVWAEAFVDNACILMAVNQELAEPGRRLKDGDVIAFFPPVTGG